MTEPPISRAMPIDRAEAINAAMVNAALWTQGIIDDEPDLSALSGVSLADMLAAKAGIEARNAAARTASGGYTITVIPDDRLIAAAYTLLSYDAEHRPIVCAGGKAVAVLPLRAAAANNEESA